MNKLYNFPIFAFSVITFLFCTFSSNAAGVYAADKSSNIVFFSSEDSSLSFTDEDSDEISAKAQEALISDSESYISTSDEDAAEIARVNSLKERNKIISICAAIASVIFLIAAILVFRAKHRKKYYL
ncbi:MAG: hypothetical protein K6F97_06895 [Lachnospiraceae bacterium]|nr:hypothetical protein [Lachnospiraceae bacterium]